jgi:signal transduction histidine kinase
MKIDWLSKLQYFLQTMAFCLAISAIQYAFQPERPYEYPLVYSLCIGFFTWALIDFGRHPLSGNSEIGWPTGIRAFLLPLGGILGAFVLGILVADSWFGWSSWEEGRRATLPSALLITALSGASVTYYFYTRSKGSYLEAQVSEVSRQASEAKLKLLETQLEPHMLFNTLANLRVLIATDPQRAQDMLDRMVAYLRATLSASRASSHALEREFERLRDYLELMAVRMGPRLRYVLDLPPELASHSVPTLLLQPLVENSIKHGLEPALQGGGITITALREGTVLTLQVSDTGVGFDNQMPLVEGFGLAQVRERLAAAYGDRGWVERTSTPGHGTTVRLHLPLSP